MIVIEEVVSRLYRELKKPDNTVFKYRHPNNEKGTFIVINMPTLSGIQDQQGIINVNIYTDNLGHDLSQPNSLLLNELSQEILPIVNSTWKDNELVDIASQGMFYEEKQTFYNFKLNYRRLNYG